MEQRIADRLEQFRELVRKIKGYSEAVGLMGWDLRTGAPRKGAEIRSETLGMLSTEMFKLQISDEMGEYLAFLTAPEVYEQLDDLNRRIVDDCKKDYDRNKSIPAKKYEEHAVLTSHAQTLWEDAKESGDFAGFEPYLTKIVQLTNEFIDYWGIKGTRYDTLLDIYEPDLTVDKLDEVFSRLRSRLVPLAERIQASDNKPDSEFLKQLFEKEQQEKFGLYILEQMGYDFEAGRLDESVHPFAIGLNPRDVRITTHYLQDDVTSAVFSSLHEGGHALYEQNIDTALSGTPLAEGLSLIHI